MAPTRMVIAVSAAFLLFGASAAGAARPTPDRTSAKTQSPRAAAAAVCQTNAHTTTCVRPAPKGAVVEFLLPHAHSQPSSIANAPDGNLWFTEIATGRIGRITPTGNISEFDAPVLKGQCESDPTPCTIAAGPDGNMWFTGGPQIGRITPTGQVTSFPLPGAATYGITAGSDGNIWFTQPTASEIGRISPAGTVTEFAVPPPPFQPFVATPIYEPEALTLGTDGALWFTDSTRNVIGRMTMTGSVTTFSITPGSNRTTSPTAITAGPDGNIWFSEIGPQRIALITPSGTIREFKNGLALYSLTAGPDNNVWGLFGSVARVLRDGSATLFDMNEEINNRNPSGITTGHDGHIWYADTAGNRIARLNVGSLTGPTVRCVVPRLTGKTPNAARRSLARTHCKLGKVRHAHHPKGHTITAQSRAPGTKLPQHSAVSVTVG
jgi:streptogramin lyase